MKRVAQLDFGTGSVDARGMRHAFLWSALFIGLAACRSHGATHSTATTSAPAEPSGSVGSSSGSAAVNPAGAAPKIVRAPSLDAAAPYIREQVREAKAQGQTPLVYVGAPWCEPCRHFHEAVSAGELNGLLADTRIIEFDADEHAGLLHDAGYAFRFIPLIAIPAPDGRSSGKQLSGSIKGPTAVKADLIPRLRTLLGRP